MVNLGPQPYQWLATSGINRAALQMHEIGLAGFNAGGFQNGFVAGQFIKSHFGRQENFKFLF
ncbi:hypothetical protein GCM10027345_30050 [Hymenobacter daeguensis]